MMYTEGCISSSRSGKPTGSVRQRLHQTTAAQRGQIGGCRPSPQQEGGMAQEDIVPRQAGEGSQGFVQCCEDSRNRGSAFPTPSPRLRGTQQTCLPARQGTRSFPGAGRCRRQRSWASEGTMGTRPRGLTHTGLRAQRGGPPLGEAQASSQTGASQRD